VRADELQGVAVGTAAAAPLAPAGEIYSVVDTVDDASVRLRAVEDPRQRAGRYSVTVTLLDSRLGMPSPPPEAVDVHVAAGPPQSVGLLRAERGDRPHRASRKSAAHPSILDLTALTCTGCGEGRSLLRGVAVVAVSAAGEELPLPEGAVVCAKVLTEDQAPAAAVVVIAE